MGDEEFFSAGDDDVPMEDPAQSAQRRERHNMYFEDDPKFLKSAFDYPEHARDSLAELMDAVESKTGQPFFWKPKDQFATAFNADFARIEKVAADENADVQQIVEQIEVDFD